MDIIKYFGCFVCLALFYGPNFSEAQHMMGDPFYPRRGGFRRGMYPRIPPIRPYPRRMIYPGTGIYEPSILPVVRRPAVVSDRSDARRQNINISNNNENIRENHGSGNVNVNQVTNSRTRRCDCHADPFMQQCGPYQRCVRDTTCTGGAGNGVCQDAGFGGGHGGIMI